MKFVYCFGLVVCGLLIVGCGGDDGRPKLGKVEGTVTLDGQPLPGVMIVFDQPGFRASTGKTDEKGRYDLTYLRDIKGAVVGRHKVKIRKLPAKEGQAVRNRLPDRYNRETELFAEVEKGSNTCNFDLESK